MNTVQNNQRRPSAQRTPPPFDGRTSQVNVNQRECKTQPQQNAGTSARVPKVQFSKILTGFVALTMYPVSIYVIVKCLGLAEMAIDQGFTGSLPYITAIIGFVEAAITIIMACYFDNSKAEKVARYKAESYSYSGTYNTGSASGMKCDF